MPVWPADLPSPIFKSILITGTKSTLRGDMDSGPAKQRPQFTKAPRMVSLSFLLSSDQIQIFEQFYDLDLAQGAFEFDMKHPLTGVVKTFRMIGNKPYKMQPLGTGQGTLRSKLSIELELFN